MNKALFKATFKANYKLLLLIFGVMGFYAFIILSMYDEASLSGLEEIFEMFPEALIKAMGFSLMDSSLVGYLAGYYYGFLIIAFPMIYISILGPRVIAKHIDSNSMSFILSTPNSRVKVSLTQGLYVLLSMVFLLFLVMILIMGLSALMFPGSLNMMQFLLMNLNVVGLFVFISGLSFLCSCIANETKTAVLYGSGIPILFFVVDMLKNANDKLDILKYFTIFTLFDTRHVLDKNPLIYLNMGILYVSGLMLFGLGIYIFNKKDLNI